MSARAAAERLERASVLASAIQGRWRLDDIETLARWIERTAPAELTIVDAGWRMRCWGIEAEGPGRCEAIARWCAAVERQAAETEGMS